MADQDITVSAAKLRDLAVRALAKVGVPEADAAVAADMLVHTDLRGIESHGVAHLASFYVGGIRRGAINPRPDIRLVRDSAATAVIDGDRGLGFVVGHRAMTEAMRRASDTGAAFVAVRNSTHCGAGFNYAVMALPRDMVGMAMTTGGPVMAPPGAAGRAIGVNVTSVAAPSGGVPFVLDMATSVVAVGKLEIAARRGESIPEGWALDSEGRPTTEPAGFFGGGAMLPLGGTPAMGSYKGFGLAVAIDILCSVLSGAGFSAELEGTFCHGFAALRIDAFLPLDEFKAHMDRMAARIKATPRLPGVGQLRLAGEVEYELEARRRAEGIPLHPQVVDSLRAMCRELDIPVEI